MNPYPTDPSRPGWSRHDEYRSCRWPRQTRFAPPHRPLRPRRRRPRGEPFYARRAQDGGTEHGHRPPDPGAAEARDPPHGANQHMEPASPPPRDRRKRPRHPESPPDRRRLSRARDFVSRYRVPLVGLTIAGAAAPLARAPEAPTAKPAKDGQRERAARAAAATPLADQIARRWAEARSERLRNDTIQGAQVRFGIDPSLAEEIYDIAVEEGIEPDVAFGLVNVESTFRQRAVSHVGARGLTQVMPRTARGMMPGITAEDLFDRRTNLTLGFRYLREMINKYDGNLRLALLAYNRGPGTVDRILARGGNPNNGYADRVLSD